MSKKNYRISEKAIQDLNTIWVYTLHKWSKEQADRYYQLILNEIEFIAHHPMAGKSIDSIRKNYRVVSVKSHLIFYRSVENNAVEIVRILHQRMDVKKHLK